MYRIYSITHRGVYFSGGRWGEVLIARQRLLEGGVYSHNNKYVSLVIRSTVSLCLLRLYHCSQALIYLLSRRKGHVCTVVIVLCKRCGPSHYFVPCFSWHVAFIGVRHLLERAVFISVDFAVGEAFIGGWHLLEGGI